MRVGILFSGGKDSMYALYKASQYEEPVCLISVLSSNTESFMFHTPGQVLLRYQAEAVGLPLVAVASKGEKEVELADLEKAIVEAKKKHKIGGIVTGALASTYQAARVQRICLKHKLWCFNPLWQKNQLVLLHELLQDGFIIGINAVAAEPFGIEWLGRIIDDHTVEELGRLAERYGINPAGEGGEYETFVLDSPVHKKKLVVDEPKAVFEKGAGVVNYKSIRLVAKAPGQKPSKPFTFKEVDI
jgi:ABC transporter with metal-binding/Fe-S-binding domain ATP-binding protein